MEIYTIETIRRLTAECERAARSIRSYANDPDALRAWAKRIESGIAPNGNNITALSLESSAAAGREYLKTQEVNS